MTKTKTARAAQMKSDRLFVGMMPAGVVYADRSRERNGDYVRLAFLSYATLVLTVEKGCPADLRTQIETDAAGLQARAGQTLEVSACGQKVLLGGAKRPGEYPAGRPV